MRLENFILYAVVISVLLVIGLVLRGCHVERTNPCVEYGEPYQTTVYIKSGNILIPSTSTHRDCLRRRDDDGLGQEVR